MHKNRWGTLFRWSVTLSIAVYLAFKVDWLEIAKQLGNAKFVWLMVACALFGVVYVLAAIRWWFLLHIQGIYLPLRATVALTFIGQFFNSFLLGAVGGDILKIFYIQKYAPHQKTHAVLSIMMDRALGLMILLGGCLISVPSQSEWLMRGGESDIIIFNLLVLVGLCGVIAIAVAFTPFHRAPSGLRDIWKRIPHRHIVELTVSGFRQHGNSLQLTSASLAVGTILTLILVTAGSCIAFGIGLNVTYVQMWIILAIVICAISLPISIGGHGVREAIFVLMFASFGLITVDPRSWVGQEPAILFSLLFFAIQLFWSLVGGVVYLTFRHDYSTLR